MTSSSTAHDDALIDAMMVAFELHSASGLRAVLDAGLDPRLPVRDKLPVYWLTEMYSRSDEFPACLRLLLEHGATLDDPIVAPVLLDDASALAAAIRDTPQLVHHRTSMVSSFTPLDGASLLHVAAEYGNVDVARVLVDMGADVNATAATDVHGLGGHTPIFHAVNSIHSRSAPILRLLLDAGARVDITLAGITWGRGFEWETTVFDVTPISYAQCGLLPQMHRKERDIYDNITTLLAAAGRSIPPLGNVPNKYLARG